MGSEAPVEFRILGPVEALVGADSVPLGPPKQRALLAALLLARGAVVSRERLVDGLWGSDPPASAVESLQVYVHKLRRALGSGRIETSGSGYRVPLDDAQLDLARFERELEGGRRTLAAGDAAEAADCLRAALALWRGPALADLPRDAPTAAEAERLEELRLAALELWNDAELACGRHDGLTATLEPLVAEHPYRERFREQQILALYRSGRQQEALEAYRNARRALDELGIEPSPRLKELEGAILRQEPGLRQPDQALPQRARLPGPPTALVGRRLEIAAITALLRDEDARLVTLTGAGGTGKTRVALAVAAELEPELRDGALFVDLAPVSDAGLVLSSIGEALGLQPGTRPLEEAVADHLRSKRMLLVLDNLEQLLPAAPAVAELLASAPELLVLATSRAPLRLRAEQEYPVPPLPIPDNRLPFEDLIRGDAVRLFEARARDVNPGFRLDEAAARDVARVCARLDGLPLAIELAAARAKLLSPPEMLERLPHLLGSGPRDAPARQRTLTATIQWSYDLLTEEERRAFAQFGVFAGGATIEAAERVCEAPLDVFAGLVDHSLLQQDAAGGRLTMLETVRSCALERVAETDADSVRVRHALWLTELAEEAEAAMRTGGDSASWLDRLQAEHDNIRAALGWTLEAGEIDLALRLASALRVFWEVRGHFAEGEQWLDQALARRQGDTAVRAKALSAAGTAAFRVGDLDRARVRYTEMLELWQEVGDELGIARGLSDLGTVAAGVGDLDLAVEMLEKSAARFRELDEPARLAIVLQNLGHVASERGDYDEAIRVTEEALALEQEVGFKPNEAITRYNLGSFLFKAGRADEAILWLEQCLALTVDLDYKEVSAYALATVVQIRLVEADAPGAAQLSGVADGLLAEAGVALQTHEQEAFERAKEETREALGEAAYEAAHAAGRDAPLREALTEAGLLAPA
ncbi:MAG TPA: BTAD domain-containing putative transcriptional regulator [Thermoleophilaceae bacterium]